MANDVRFSPYVPGPEYRSCLYTAHSSCALSASFSLVLKFTPLLLYFSNTRSLHYKPWTLFTSFLCHHRFISVLILFVCHYVLDKNALEPSWFVTSDPCRIVGYIDWGQLFISNSLKHFLRVLTNRNLSYQPFQHPPTIFKVMIWTNTITCPTVHNARRLAEPTYLTVFFIPKTLRGSRYRGCRPRLFEML